MRQSLWHDEWRVFLAAVQYFTRVPVPASVGHEPAPLKDAVRYLPAVGLLVGAASAGAFSVAAVLLPVRLAVLLALAFAIYLTGAFHEDGLADSADGLGGGFDRARILSIMKDPRLGTFGVLALLFATLLKWEALALLSPGWIRFALIGGHAVSRAATVLLMASLPYVRDGEDSRARPLVTVGRQTVAVALLTGALPLLYGGRPGVAASAFCLAVLLLWRARLAARLGGYTGDALGAAQQLTEIAFCLGLVATVHGP